MLSGIAAALQQKKEQLKSTTTTITKRSGEVVEVQPDGTEIVINTNKPPPPCLQNQPKVEEEVIKKPLAAFHSKTPVLGSPFIIWCKEPDVVTQLWREQEQIPLPTTGKERIYIPTDSDLGKSFVLKASRPGDTELIQISSNSTILPLPPRKVLYLKENKEVDQLDVHPEYFRVGQYNIMADMYTEPPDYTYCEPSTLYWSFRQYNWKKEIQLYNPDILCMQEVEEEALEKVLNPFLEERGYLGIVKMNRRPEGSAIYWKTRRFTLIKSESQLIGTLAMTQWKDESSKEHLLYCNLLNKIGGLGHHNVVAVVVLQDNQTNKKIIIATTHLYWGGGLSHDHCFQAQIIQAYLITEYLYKLQQIYGNIPLILTGDFNSKGQSAVATFLQSSSIPGDHPVLTRNGQEDSTADHDLVNKLEPLKLKEVHSLRQSGPLELTVVTSEFHGAIDYIWHSSELLEVGAIVQPYHNDVYTQFGGLPNIFLTSDHISLFADLKIKQ